MSARFYAILLQQKEEESYQDERNACDPANYILFDSGQDKPTQVDRYYCIHGQRCHGSS